MPIRTSGLGGEAFGDPMGGGGPIHVVRARAVKGQVVRVVFDEAPLTTSAAGTLDALNPSNYLVEVVTGQAGQPLAVGVDPDPIAGPTLAVATGEVAIDLHVDRPLAVGVRYRVTARDLVSKLGGSLGYPYSAEFMGVQAVASIKPPLRRSDLIDIRNDAFEGRYGIATSGDLANHGGLDGLRKRILRRLSTPKDAFAHLPGYGVGIQLKGLASVAQLQVFQQDALTQVRQEPEVVDASVAISQDSSAPEVVRVDVSARTRTGLTVSVGASISPDGIQV